MTPPSPAMPKPMSVSMLGVRPGVRHALREGLDQLAQGIPPRRRGRRRDGAGVTVGRGHRCVGRQDARPRSASSRSWNRSRVPSRQGADDLAARPAGLDQAGRPQPAQVPRHERLRQVHVMHQVGHGARRVGEPLEHAQPGRVGQRLVHHGDLPQVLRRRGHGGDGGADPGGAGQSSGPLRAVISTRLHISAG